MNKTLLAFAVCAVSCQFAVFAQKTKPSGKITKEERKVAEFEDIDLDGMFNVFITQSDTETVYVETDENLQKLIVVESKDAILRVYDKEESTKFKHIKMNVYIQVSDIQKLKTDLFESKLTCTGMLKLNQLEFINIGSGQISLNCNAQEIVADIQGLANVNLEGSVETLKINSSGSGNIQAKKCNVGLFQLVNTGTGNIEFGEIKEISVTSSGPGHIYYRGDPNIRKIEMTGTGRIKKMH